VNQYDESSRVIFEDKDLGHRVQISPLQQPSQFQFTQWFIKHSAGYIKDENQANHALLAFVGFFVFIALVIFFSFSGSKSKPHAPSIIGIYPR
jgi:hypothetical protein